MMTLAEALRRATHDLGYCSHGGDAEHLAAAVLAWMQEPAQIERMARAMQDRKTAGNVRMPFDGLSRGNKYSRLNDIRAAVAALAGETRGG